jgi:hypothetical protein
MKKISPKWSGQGLRFSLPLVVAALSLAGAKAQAADFTVAVDPASPNDHTAVIQAALDNDNYTRVILPYRSAGWITRPLNMGTAGQELWIKGSGSTPGKLVAKYGYPNFQNTHDCLINMTTAGCKINGYSNGVDKTSGMATLEMFKSSYTAANGYTTGEWRHTVRIFQNNSTVKGVILKNSGGDGIYHDQGVGTRIKDVISDGSNRNGISIIKADDLEIRDSTFKNTSGSATTGTGAGPHAGIDFEPNHATDSLTNIRVWNCIFSYNAGDNILVDIRNLTGTGVGSTIGIYFYNTVNDHAGSSGIQVKNMKADGPSLGQIYFQDSDISYSSGAGIKMREYRAGRARTTFNRFEMWQCANSSIYAPIYMEDGSGATDSLGRVEFVNGCYVNDYGSSHASILYGMSYGATNWNSIVGQIYYRCNYTPAITPANARYFSGGSHTETNVTVTMTPY